MKLSDGMWVKNKQLEILFPASKHTIRRTKPLIMFAWITPSFNSNLAFAILSTIFYFCVTRLRFCVVIAISSYWRKFLTLQYWDLFIIILFSKEKGGGYLSYVSKAPKKTNKNLCINTLNQIEIYRYKCFLEFKKYQ